MEWVLAIYTTYHTNCGLKLQRNYIYGLATEKACVQRQAMEDAHLKKIKKMTNIESVSYECFKK